MDLLDGLWRCDYVLIKIFASVVRAQNMHNHFIIALPSRYLRQNGSSTYRRVQTSQSNLYSCKFLYLHPRRIIVTEVLWMCSLHSAPPFHCRWRILTGRNTAYATFMVRTLTVRLLEVHYNLWAWRAKHSIWIVGLTKWVFKEDLVDITEAPDGSKFMYLNRPGEAAMEMAQRENVLDRTFYDFSWAKDKLQVATKMLNL